MKFVLILIIPLLITACSGSDSGGDSPSITIVNSPAQTNPEEIENPSSDSITTEELAGEVSLVGDNPLVIVNPNSLNESEEDESVEPSRIPEVEFEEPRAITVVPERTISETASDFLKNPEVLEEENLVDDQVSEIVEAEEFDLNKALTEIDLIEFELTKVGCRFELEKVFSGFIVEKYEGEFRCPSRMRPLDIAKAIYHMNSFLYLANNIPGEILSENNRHLLVVKVRELGKTRQTKIEAAIQSLSRATQRYAQYQERFRELACVFDSSCIPSESQLSSIQTITAECTGHLRELGVYSRVWPILGDLPYIEMETFFNQCIDDGQRVLDEYLPAIGVGDGDSVTDPEDLGLEFSCYSNTTRARLYCQRIKDRINDWSKDEDFRELILRLGVTQIRIDESSNQTIQIVGDILVVFREYREKSVLMSAILDSDRG